MTKGKVVAKAAASFNTDNGIRRATIRKDNVPDSVDFTFQYRQRYQEGYNLLKKPSSWQKKTTFQYRQR